MKYAASLARLFLPDMLTAAKAGRQLKAGRNVNGGADIRSGFVLKALPSPAAGGGGGGLLSILSRRFHSHRLVPTEVENPSPYCAIVSPRRQMNINCINFQ